MGNQALCGEAAQAHCIERCTMHHDGFQVDAEICDPAGAVFDETLEGLNELDRQLLTFSSSANTIAVRWLLKLGATWHASDSNATSCLHAACRSGAPSIVATFLRLAREEKSLTSISKPDCAGWTPLHIGVFMGRTSVVSLLLEARAEVGLKNKAKQSALDLCSDSKLRGMLGADSSVKPKPVDPQGQFRDILVHSHSDRVIPEEPGELWLQTVRFEPFFVPRIPIIMEKDREKSFSLSMMLPNLGRDIFNRQPGRGLAFIVSSGCARDYPLDLVAFMRCNRHCLDPCQIGQFLGEDFSLSKILRLEFINSLGLLHSGVLASLCKAFAHFRPPGDLQKVDRLASGIAEVWWRQHHRKGTHPPTDLDENVDVDGTLGDAELEGFVLLRQLASPDVLHRLLFSVILLHGNLHGSLKGTGPLTLEGWLAVNDGIASAGRNIPRRVLVSLYHAVARQNVEQLHLGGSASSKGSPGDKPLPPEEEEVEERADAKQETGASHSAVAKHAQVEGWVRIVGRRLPLPNPGGQKDYGAEYSGVSSVLSEATASSRRHMGEASWPQRVDASSSLASAPGAPAQDAVWLSLCDAILFLSSSRQQNSSPFAFVYLRVVRFAAIDPPRRTIILDGTSGNLAHPALLQMVFLLPDGRWQSYGIPRLEMEMCDDVDFDTWLQLFTVLSKIDSEAPKMPTMIQKPRSMPTKTASQTPPSVAALG
mmetsp:Transcript_53359/g.115327  ORF Transcript_53359/g.115327 Transcript_53359/m.115327 type:complete len:708 (-) Transcript_53359:187-2310(-)